MSLHDPQTDQWHVDRRVPLALIWTIAAQTAALIVAGTILWAEVQTQGRDLARLDAQAQREVLRIDAQLQREVTPQDHPKGNPMFPDTFVVVAPISSRSSGCSSPS